MPTICSSDWAASCKPVWRPCSKACSRASVKSSSEKVGGGGASSSCSSTMISSSTWAAISTGAMRGAPKSRSNKYFWSFAICPYSVDQFVFFSAFRDHDLAAGRQFLRHGDDHALRLIDIAQADRAHRVHVFLEHLAGAFGHILEEQILDRFRTALERDRQLVLFDRAQQGLDTGRVDAHQI